MAWDNRNPNTRGFGQQSGYNRSYGQNGGQLRTQGETAAEIKPLPIPEDYVDAAEKVMRALFANRSRITTTKMRGFFDARQ